MLGVDGANKLKLIFPVVYLKMYFIFQIIYIFLKHEIRRIFLFFKFFFSKSFFLLKGTKTYNFDYYDNLIHSNASNGKILITTFVNVYDYLKYEYLIGIQLSKIKKENIIILLSNKDINSLDFFKKLGVSKFIYFNDGNFLSRTFNLIKSYKILKNIKCIEDFINFTYQDLPVGKMIYTHHCRFSGIPTSSFIRPEYFILLSNILIYKKQFEKIVNKYNISNIIESEPQFIPGSVITAVALKKNIYVLSRVGGNNKISVRRINQISLFYENRWKFNKKIFEEIKLKAKEYAIEKGKKIITNRFLEIDNVDKEIDQESVMLDSSKKISLINDYDKNKICKMFNWEYQKPIGIILANDLTDGLFPGKWGVYRDNYIWLKKTIQEASYNKEMNWLVKPHPNEIKNKVTLTTRNLFKHKKYDKNIVLFPKNYSIKNLPKIVDLVVSNHGSAGYEYPALGIPAITSGETIYSDLNISYEAKNEINYFKYLKNAHEIKKLKSSTIENALIFIFIYSIFTKIDYKFVNPDYLAKNESETFWQDLKSINDNLKTDLDDLDDVFLKSFEYQISNNLKHTFDINLSKKLNLDL